MNPLVLCYKKIDRAYTQGMQKIRIQKIILVFQWTKSVFKIFFLQPPCFFNDLVFFGFAE